MPLEQCGRDLTGGFQRQSEYDDLRKALDQLVADKPVLERRLRAAQSVHAACRRDSTDYLKARCSSTPSSTQGGVSAAGCPDNASSPAADMPSHLPWAASAMCGRLRVGKDNLHVAGLVGAAMCSAC
jgi:hypothetical protein